MNFFALILSYYCTWVAKTFTDFARKRQNVAKKTAWLSDHFCQKNNNLSAAIEKACLRSKKLTSTHFLYVEHFANRCISILNRKESNCENKRKHFSREWSSRLLECLQGCAKFVCDFRKKIKFCAKIFAKFRRYNEILHFPKVRKGCVKTVHLYFLNL
jgi:hypothetical protein